VEIFLTEGLVDLTELAREYRTATVKGAWYGPALAEMLDKISPEMAVETPVAGANSIAALLQHLLLWNERARNTSENRPLPKWEADKEWAEPPIPWAELLPRWKKSRDRLEEHIRHFPVEQLAQQVPGRDYCYEKLLTGIVQHAIYHSGQIAMIIGVLQRAAK
jgi:uncharacterized damage-inducible protein DinB